MRERYRQPRGFAIERARMPFVSRTPRAWNVLAIGFLCVWACGSQAEPSTPTRDQCDQRSGVRIGHDGKDVMWVPTPDKLVAAMLAAAQTGPSDFVVDLGAGDGKIPIAAAKQFGARALGIEYDPAMVQLARCYVAAEGVADRVEIRQANIFETELSDATVVTLYLLPKLNRKLRPKLLALEPGTRVVSNRFKMGRWRPDQIVSVEGVSNQGLLWIVPARVAGVWQFSEETGSRRFRARFAQQFQLIRGVLLGVSGDVRRAQLRGRHIEFIVSFGSQRLHLAGEVTSNEMRLRTADGSSTLYIGRRE